MNKIIKLKKYYCFFINIKLNVILLTQRPADLRIFLKNLKKEQQEMTSQEIMLFWNITPFFSCYN